MIHLDWPIGLGCQITSASYIKISSLFAVLQVASSLVPPPLSLSLELQHRG